MGRLVGGVAHDFANLLTLIAGYSDILLNKVGNKDPLRPELEEIRKAAARGTRLTSQLLGFTRGQTASARVVDLNMVIADLERMLRSIIGEYIVLETALSPNLAFVVADAGQIEQVVMNLILNARDAMPTGGRVRIETINSVLTDVEAKLHGMKPGRCVMLTITDTGHGIDPELAPHIFEPFFTTKENGKGTGLGLSTAYAVVKQAGGDIWHRGAEEAGACFTVCLPAAEPSVVASELAPATVPESAGSETLLLVEDEDSVRRLLSHVLRKRGYRVLEASTPETALEMFEEQSSRIDLVLTDMVMPQMSGRELGEKLHEARRDLKIIYMSGYTDDVLVRTGALSPGMSFLQKPLRPEVLAAKVREALDSPARPFNPA